MNPIIDSEMSADHYATNAEELFAKVTSAEDVVANPSAEEDDLLASLSLYQMCMGIVAESTVIDLTTEQRAEFNARMDRIESHLQQRAMSAFTD
jgi:hypothetical protein